MKYSNKQAAQASRVAVIKMAILNAIPDDAAICDLLQALNQIEASILADWVKQELEEEAADEG